jgi:hypothetical protein
LKEKFYNTLKKYLENQRQGKQWIIY